MRIIAGEKKGLRLNQPKDESIRPTSDKIRGAIYNTIQMDVMGGNCFVDLFGGSGAMGIEALSRGVKKAIFFDSSQDSITLIKSNIKKAAFESRSIIKLTTAQLGIEWMAQNQIQADFIFMDPPYHLGEILVPLAEQIIQKKIIKSSGIIMMEHEKSVIMPINVGDFSKVKEKNYGLTTITYYGRE